MITDKEPRIDFRHQFSCDGTLSAGTVSIPVDGFSVSRTKYQTSIEIGFSTHVATQHSDKSDELFRHDPLEFRGRLYRQRDVSARCHALRVSDNKIEGTISELDIDVRQLDKSPIKQTVLVQFTPTDLALSELQTVVHDWSGEMKAFDDEKRKPMTLDLNCGVGEFSRRYSYEDAYVDDVRATVRIPMPTLVMHINEACRTTDMNSLITSVAEQIGNVEAIISFLSRRQVRWTEIEVISKGDDQRSDIVGARRLRSTFGSGEPQYPLIRSIVLGERDLNDVLQAFVSSPYRESIEHTINYLNAHWRKDFLESDLANSFTAFETLINGIDSLDGTDSAVPPAAFKQLRTVLEQQIKDFSNVSGWDKQTRKEMYSKLAELQRRPVVPRAVSLLRHYNVDWADVWDPGSDLEEELNKAYARRSRFIHVGRIDDFREAALDAERMHTLTERLLYNLLGGKQEWIYPSAYAIWHWKRPKKG